MYPWKNQRKIMGIPVIIMLINLDNETAVDTKHILKIRKGENKECLIVHLEDKKVFRLCFDKKDELEEAYALLVYLSTYSELVNVEPEKIANSRDRLSIKQRVKQISKTDK